jgi:uncharacterized protein (TIGR02453 family)
LADRFAGFGPAAFAFLRELAAEQNRAWFMAHKDAYEADVRWPMTALLADLTSDFARLGIPLQADPKRSVFRVNRDVRFSKDKRLYKTHIGATLTRDGGKMTQGLLYIHIDPLGCFAAAGFYRPDPAQIQALRAGIAREPAAFRDAIRSLPLSPDEDPLKRTPRGFEHVADPDLIEALRRRSFIARLPLTEAQVGGPELIERVTAFATDALPLLRFGWRAMEDRR